PLKYSSDMLGSVNCDGFVCEYFPGVVLQFLRDLLTQPPVDGFECFPEHERPTSAWCASLATTWISPFSIILNAVSCSSSPKSPVTEAAVTWASAPLFTNWYKRPGLPAISAHLSGWAITGIYLFSISSSMTVS